MSNAKVVHINFIDEKSKISIKPDLTYKFVILILAFMILIAALFVVIEKKYTNNLAEVITQKSQEAESLITEKAKKLKSFNDIKETKQVLNNPIIWSKIINKVTQDKPDSITYKSISGDIKDKRVLSLHGKASFMADLIGLKDQISNIKECKKASIISIEQEIDNSLNKDFNFKIECEII
jgi:hypothetical protein